MVAINFSPRFAKLVAKGTKRQTIRKTTKAYTGCKLQLYTGQRTKKCRKLKNAVCESVASIQLRGCGICIEGQITDEREDLDKFAVADGFKDYKEMWAWFMDRYSLHYIDPFDGWLIKW